MPCLSAACCLEIEEAEMFFLCPLHREGSQICGKSTPMNRAPPSVGHYTVHFVTMATQTLIIHTLFLPPCLPARSNLTFCGFKLKNTSGSGTIWCPHLLLLAILEMSRLTDTSLYLNSHSGQEVEKLGCCLLFIIVVYTVFPQQVSCSK